MRDLKQIRIANPCDENWDAMPGDAGARFCERCDTSVVNLSSMTPNEVDELVASSNDCFCARFLARPNGTPVLRSPPRRSFLRRLASLVAIVAPLVAGGCRDDADEGIDPDLYGSCQPFTGFIE